MSTASSDRALTVRVLLAYAAARTVTTVAWLVAVDQLRGVRMIAGGPFRLWQPALLRWDATYYESIARAGYPTELPVDASGAVLPSVWAFLPSFPFGAGALARVAHLPFATAAMIWNLAMGAATAVLLARLARTFDGEETAFRTSLFWMCWPTAFLLHMPYSEATFLALACGSLLAMRTGRDGWAAALLVAASLSRGFVLPLSAAALAHVLWPSRTHADNERDTVRSGTGGRRWLLAIVAMASPFIWPAIAAIVTGRLDAVVATQHAWGLSADPRALVNAWRDGFARDGWPLLVSSSSLAVVLTIASVIGVAARASVPRALKAYAIVAMLLIVALAQPGAVAFGSVPRFTFAALAPPLAMAEVPLRRWVVAAIVVGMTVLQYLWIAEIWSGFRGIAP